MSIRHEKQNFSYLSTKIKFRKFPKGLQKPFSMRGKT